MDEWISPSFSQLLHWSIDQSISQNYIVLRRTRLAWQYIKYFMYIRKIRKLQN